MTALRVVLAIGKTGDSRRLGVPGETLPHVYNRLIDPGEFTGLDILVVGGGDSAVEAAVALAEAGNRVTLVLSQGGSRPAQGREPGALRSLSPRGAASRPCSTAG